MLVITTIQDRIKKNKVIFTEELGCAGKQLDRQRSELWLWLQLSWSFLIIRVVDVTFGSWCVE